MTPEEQEISRKQEEIKQLEQKLADIDAQYADFCIDLKRFESDYLSRSPKLVIRKLRPKMARGWGLLCETQTGLNFGWWP